MRDPRASCTGALASKDLAKVIEKPKDTGLPEVKFAKGVLLNDLKNKLISKKTK